MGSERRGGRVSRRLAAILIGVILGAGVALVVGDLVHGDNRSIPQSTTILHEIDEARVRIYTLRGKLLGRCAIHGGDKADLLVCTLEGNSMLGIYSANGKYLGNCWFGKSPRGNSKLVCIEERGAPA
jgi:hypothetical protein